MCIGGGANQGPLGPKFDALTTAPLRHLIKSFNGKCSNDHSDKGFMFEAA